MHAIKSKRKTIFNYPSGWHMLHCIPALPAEFKDACVSLTHTTDVCTGFVWQSQCGNSLNVIARLMVHYISEPVHSHRYRLLILQTQTNDMKIPSKTAVEKPLKLHNTVFFFRSIFIPCDAKHQVLVLASQREERDLLIFISMGVQTAVRGIDCTKNI